MKTKHYEQNEGNLASHNINHIYFFDCKSNNDGSKENTVVILLVISLASKYACVHVVLSLNYDAVKLKLYQI